MKDGQPCQDKDYLRDNHLLELWTVDGAAMSRTHRITGPAAIYDDQYYWYVNNICCKYFSHFQRLSKNTDADMLAIRLRWPVFDHYDDPRWN